MLPTIGDYYRGAIEQLGREVASTPDDRIVGMDETEWIEYLRQKYGMQEIRFDDTRETSLEEVETERELRTYDIFSDSQPGTIVRSTQVRIRVPVISSDTIRVIEQNGLAPNSYSLTHYPEFEFDERQGCLSVVVTPDASAVNNGVERIRNAARAYNESISSENRSFEPKVAEIVRKKRAELENKLDNLDALAVTVGIPLKKKADVSVVVPTTPRVRSVIAPVLPPAGTRKAEPALAPDRFEAILSLVDNQCRQFERTPQAFRQLTEESLRDIVLSSLNAVFEGAAGGETFQGVGKVDIHLRVDEGEVFVSEVKFWDGPESLRDVIGQLRGRLTWRESYGVAIVLSRNLGFSDVLRSVVDTLPNLEGFVAGSNREEATNHFRGRFEIPSDPKRQATIHVLVYNLFVPDPPRRALRRVKS